MQTIRPAFLFRFGSTHPSLGKRRKHEERNKSSKNECIASHRNRLTSTRQIKTPPKPSISDDSSPSGRAAVLRFSVRLNSPLAGKEGDPDGHVEDEAEQHDEAEGRVPPIEAIVGRDELLRDPLRVVVEGIVVRLRIGQHGFVLLRQLAGRERGTPYGRWGGGGGRVRSRVPARLLSHFFVVCALAIEHAASLPAGKEGRSTRTYTFERGTTNIFGATSKYF